MKLRTSTRALVVLVCLLLGACGDGNPSAPSAAPSELPGVAVDVLDHCSFGVSVQLDGEVYLLDGALDGVASYPGRPWERGDFPSDWDVDVLNEKAFDGDGYLIRGLRGEITSEGDLDVIDPATGLVVGRFVLDTTPPEERFFCG